jgi:hypothetical protein
MSIRNRSIRNRSIRNRSFEISAELGRLSAEQTNFLRKMKLTSTERQEYENSRDRVRELFAELEQLAKVA